MADIATNMPIEIKESPLGIWFFAKDYAICANILIDHFDESTPSQPVYYLCLHAIELFLKSFLCAKNLSDVERKSIGHDLESLWIKSKELGLSDIVKLEKEDEDVISVHSFPYKRKTSEYYIGYIRTQVVLIHYVRSLMNRLYKDLEIAYRSMSLPSY